MKKYIVSTFAFLALVFSSSVSAGAWIKGYGLTPTEALNTSISIANARVKSKGKGCVDGKTRNFQALNMSGTLVFTIEIYVHNQNGSCGIDVNEKWIRDTVSKWVSP